MGLYFYLHVVRRVPDPQKQNFFINDAPSDRGIHSSYMRMLFERSQLIDPVLSPPPRWYQNAFPNAAISHDMFFKPDDVSTDLEHILAEILRRNTTLPIFYWLLIGNKAGVTQVMPRSSVDIYCGEEPCEVRSDWNSIAIWGPQGKIRDLASADPLDCRLRNIWGSDMDGTVYFQRTTFFEFMRPYLFDLFEQCDWARGRRLHVFPMWS